jgi:hypothetical protein
VHVREATGARDTVLTACDIYKDFENNIGESVIIHNTDTYFISIKIVDDVIGRTMTNLQMICHFISSRQSG